MISILTMLITLYQTSIMNKQTQIQLTQTKANAWPCLQIGKTELGNIECNCIDKYYFSVYNKGTGTAIITGVRLQYKSKAITQWDKLKEIAHIPDSIQWSRTISPISSTVLSANEGRKIISFNGNIELIKWFIQNQDLFSLEIYYKSVFDEIFYVKKTLNNTLCSLPVKVKSCPIPTEELFKN